MRAARAPVRDRGVVLLALLIAIALAGIGAMAAADVWALERQRLQEQELLFVGDQYRRAIQRYYAAAPAGTARVLPSKLEDLLSDDRHPVPVRHLRRLYPDPLTGDTAWAEVRSGGRLAGVHSVSEREPLKQAGFAPAYDHFTGRKRYSSWLFAVSPGGEPYTGDAPMPDLPPVDLAPPPPAAVHPPRAPDPGRTPPPVPPNR